MPDDGYTKAKLEDIMGMLKRIEKKIDQINGRVDKLELWRARMMAVGGVLVFGIPIAIKVLWK